MTEAHEDDRPIGHVAQAIVERLREKAPGPEDLPPPRDEWELRWEEGIPWRFREVKLEQLDDDVMVEIRAWTDDRLGGGVPTANLVLLGPVGTGKTHTGIAALQYLASYRGCSFAFFPVVELLDALRPGGDGDALLERLCSVRVLLLDDLGAEKGSEWTTERLYLLVNRRWLEGRPTIVTTNLPADELESALDPRLYSRLVDGAHALRLTGADRRRP